VIGGPFLGNHYEVAGIIRVGRGGGDIDLSKDDLVSRPHATLRATPSGVLVNDIGSTNGTFINDQLITSAEARVGDIIRFGDTSLRVDANRIP